MVYEFYTYLFYYFIVSNLIRFVTVIISSAQHPKELGEWRVGIVANVGSVLDLVHFALALLFLKEDIRIIIPDFMFFGIDFEVAWTDLSILFLGFSIVVFSLMTRFSISYLHRDTYYYKFFSLIYVLQGALCLLILTNSSESLFIGWELLGLSSILLIAFYEHRMAVLKNSLRILVVYKISDVILYSVLVYSAGRGHIYYSMITEPLAIFGFLVACLIKSSIFPWFWLPKAMEGPTPSTAIFYGGLATHVPVFIFMSIWWNQEAAPLPVYMMVMSGIIVACIICATLLSKQINDTKNSIAYAAITQLGVIYLEVIFGFYYLAVAHCIIHGIYRTLEFLMAPSALYNRRVIEENRSPSAVQSISGFGGFLPKSLRLWLYRVCYNEFAVQRVFMTLIDNFMGLAYSRANFRNIKSYILYSLSIFLIIYASATYFPESRITYNELALLAMAYLLNVLTLINKSNLKLCFLSLTLSVFACMTALSVVLFPLLNWAVWGYLLAILAISIQSYRLGTTDNNAIKFVGRNHKSPSLNMLFLLLGLSITGMPGLGTFFLWERLAHAVQDSDPALLISAFILLSFNTIAFFRFYYANYLGKHDFLEQFLATNRV